MASTFPLRLGTPEQCRALTAFLEQARFTEASLLETFGISDLNSLLMAHGEERERLQHAIEFGGLQMLLAKLFLGGYAVRWQEAARLVPNSILEILRQFGLFGEDGRCPVLFYPAHGFYVASDRPAMPDGGGYSGSDFVMSALEWLSRSYLDGIGRAPCGRFLEVGAGAGLGALLATRFAREVWATDITARSTEYTAFNRGLNGIAEEKLHVLCGDMFAPVAGLTFDRIACNPPFEPPLKPGLIYSVGGADGEQLIERVVRECIPMLSPGGRLYCQVLGTDRKSESFFNRIGRWLNGTHVGIALFTRARMSTDVYTAGQLIHTNNNAEAIAAWDRFYQTLEATHVVTGQLIVEHGASSRITETLGPNATVEDMERRIEWDSPQPDRVRNGAWIAGAGWSLEVTRTMQDGSIRPASATLHCTSPFEKSFEVPLQTLDLFSKAASGIPGSGMPDSLGQMSEWIALGVLAAKVGQ